MNDDIQRKIAELELSAEDSDLLHKICLLSDSLLDAERATLAKGEMVQLSYFFIPRSGKIVVFSPHISLIGMPKMDIEEEKDFIAIAIRNMTRQLNSVAVIAICESWFLNKKNITPAEMEFIEEHGVREHPESVDAIFCGIDFNVRGEGQHIGLAYKIEGKEGTHRTVGLLEVFPSSPGGSVTGRMVIEPEYLTPLT